MDSTTSFAFSDFGWASAAGTATTILADVDGAVTGGGSSAETVFSRDLSALRALQSAASGGVENWLTGIDTATGLETRYVAVGDTFLRVGMTVADDAPSVLAAGASDATPVGFLYLALITDGSSPTPRVTQLMNAVARYQGDPLAAFATSDGLKDLVSGLVGKATSFVSSVFVAVLDTAAADVASATASAAAAVDTAAEASSGASIITGPGGLQIQTDVLMSTGQAVSLGLGVVSVLALLALNLVAKQMTAYVRIYNATDDPLDVSLAWIHPDVGYSGPIATEFVTLLPLGRVWTPPSLIGDTAVSYAGWVLGNTDSLARIAYVLRVAAAGSFAGADVMVDIPNVGANSLAIGIGADEDFAGFWTAEHGKDTDLVASAPPGGGPYRIRMGTNQNRGQSPSPVSGALGYHFEHVVVIEPVS